MGIQVGHMACGAAFPFLIDWLKLPTGTSTGLQQSANRKIQWIPYCNPLTITKAPNKSIPLPYFDPHTSTRRILPTSWAQPKLCNSYFPGVSFTLPLILSTSSSLLYFILPTSFPVFCTLNSSPQSPLN